MAATLTMVPLAKIKPRDGFNPRAEFGDEQMAELVASVKQHGIITPLTLAPDGDGFVIVAGERRYRAAKQARLKEVPAQVRDADGDALTLAVAENVIRADLSPIEEARAYERLVAEHGDTAKVAKLVGRSEKLLGERLDLLRLPDEAQALLAARRVPLACAPALIRIAEREPLLADLCAVWLADRPSAAARFPADPGEVVDDVLEAEWQDDDSQPLHPVAYSVGGWHGPILPGGRSRDEQLPRILAKLAEHGEPVAAAYAELPAIPQEDEYDWQARQAVEQRERECFALTDEDADAARAFGCLLDLSGPDGRDHLLRHRPRVARRPALPEDRRPRQRRGGAEAARARGSHAVSLAGRPGEGGPPRAAAARLRGTRRRTRAQPRPRRGAHPLAAEARHRRGQAARLARTAPLRQGGSMGAPPLRRAADDDQQAGQGQRPLPARRAGRGRATRRSDRAPEPRENTGGRARRCPAPTRRTASRRDGRSPRSRPPGRLRAARARRIDGARQARPPRRPRLGQTAPGRAGGRARTPRAGMAGTGSGEARRAARQAGRRRTRPLRLLLRADHVTRRRRPRSTAASSTEATASSSGAAKLDQEEAA